MAEHTGEKLRMEVKPPTKSGLLVEDDTVDEAPFSSFVTGNDNISAGVEEAARVARLPERCFNTLDASPDTKTKWSQVKKDLKDRDSKAASVVIFDASKITTVCGRYRRGKEYTILSQLGKGFYGVAYLVRDKGTGSVHVLKLIPIEKFHDMEVLAYQDLRKVVCCPTLYAFQLEGRYVELHMEYIDGVNLSEVQRRIRESHPPDDTEHFFAFFILHVLLFALECLHLWITHNDLHEDNIIVVYDGCYTMQVKVIDLGLAEKVGEGKADKSKDIIQAVKHLLDMLGVETSFHDVQELRHLWNQLTGKVEPEHLRAKLKCLYDKGDPCDFESASVLRKEVETFYNFDDQDMKTQIAKVIFPTGAATMETSSEDVGNDGDGFAACMPESNDQENLPTEAAKVIFPTVPATMETSSEDVGNDGDGFAACMPESNDQENLPTEAAEVIFPTVPATMETSSEDVGNDGDGFAACMPESSGIFMEVTKPKMDDTSQDLGPRCEGDSGGMIRQTSRAVPWLLTQEPLNRVWSFGPVLSFCLLGTLLVAKVYTGN